MNAIIKFELFSGSSSLTDVNFVIQVLLMTKQINEHEATDLTLDLIKYICQKAKETSKKVHISIETFSKTVINAKDSGQWLLRPISRLLQEESDADCRRQVITSFINPAHSVHDVLSYSYLPNYFMEHPIDGLKTKIVNGFDTSITEPSLVLSVNEFTKNCFEAGYIKSPIEIRVHARKGDTKFSRLLDNVLSIVGISYTKANRIGHENNLLIWSFFINPNQNDKSHLALSEAANAKLKSMVEKQSTGKAYMVCLEGTPISPKGFKSQRDVQTFLDSLEGNLVALSSGKNPTSIYLRHTLHLLSLIDKRGDIVPLTKFRFNLKQSNSK